MARHDDQDDHDDHDGSDPGEAPEVDDGSAPGDEGSDGPRLHPAVFASNWRTVLAVDAAMGVAVAVAGVVVAVVWNVVAGGLLGACGVAYVFAVVRRGRQWAELRRAAGR